MTRPTSGEPGHFDQDEHDRLADRLAAVRAELDELVGARMLRPFNGEQHRRYRELGSEECELLRALAPCIPERRPPA